MKNDQFDNRTGYEETENSLMVEKIKNYEGEFGRYRPTFKGVPANYYPNSVGDFFIQCSMLFPAYIVAGLTFWGLLTWGLNDSELFGWVSFGVFIAYLIIVCIVVFMGSADRGQKEREYISAKIEQQKISKEREMKEAEEHMKFLEEYYKRQKATGSNVFDNDKGK